MALEDRWNPIRKGAEVSQYEKDIPLSVVDIPVRSRPLDDAAVQALSASMNMVGLLQPVVVQRARVMCGGVFVPGYRLIAGNHRLAAAKQLGWVVIDAIVVDDDISHMEAELLEIDENLCRAELTPAQRAAAIKRRREIWVQLHPNNSGTNCPTIQRGPGMPSQFAAETAVVSGETKRDINRHLSRAEALGDDLLKVAGTTLDKGVELDALKSMPADVRAPLIERAQAGERVSARAPAARISLTIEYFTVEDGAVSIASQLIRRDRWLAAALLDELRNQLGKM